MTETSIRLPTKRELIQEKYPACDAAIRLNDHAHNLAKDGKIEAAVVAFRRAAALEPDNPIVLSGFGAVLWDACLYREAEAVLRKSISIESNYAPAHGNMGATLASLGKRIEAKEHYKTSIKIEPDYSDAAWNYSIFLLDNGEWSEGWKFYDARKQRGGKQLYPVLPYPTWRGEDLNGKTLFVQGEQGVGDRILFSRYLYWVKENFPACRILFMPNAMDLPDIENFLWGYRDVIEFVPNGIPWPEADFGIYLLSIPQVHGSMPSNVVSDPGLLLANSLRHKKSVALPGVDDSMLKIGITWTGNPAMKRNGERSIPFELMMQLASLPNVVLFGLQFGTNDIHRFGADQLVCDLTHDIKPLGFVGTAAVMLNLDLVITCCTSTAHVAGVLGVPCWTLLCENPYWIWLRDRLDTIWYPTTRLFRQETMGDWKPMIEEVKEELTKFRCDQNKEAA